MAAKLASKSVWTRVARLAARQHGVVGLDQLYAFGLTRHQVAGAVADARLRRLARGVYATAVTEVSPRGLWKAATLSVPGSGISHDSAALHWHIREKPFEGRIHLSVIGDGGRAHRRGLIIHRVREPLEIRHRAGIPVTSVPRTILDLAPSMNPRALERLADEAERLHRVREKDLLAICDAHPRARGTASLRAMLSAHELGSTRTRNEFEEAFLAICDSHAIERPEVNVPVRGFEVDALWKRARLIVELDGGASHRTRRGFQSDRDRDTTLATAGYQVLRFTWRDVSERPEVVAERVRRVLALRMAPREG